MLRNELYYLHSEKSVVRVMAGNVDVSGYIAEWNDTHIMIKTTEKCFVDDNDRERNTGVKTLIAIDKIDAILSTYNSYV